MNQMQFGSENSLTNVAKTPKVLCALSATVNNYCIGNECELPCFLFRITDGDHDVPCGYSITSCTLYCHSAFKMENWTTLSYYLLFHIRLFERLSGSWVIDKRRIMRL